MLVQTRSSAYRREVLAFIMQCVLLVIGVVGVILVGTHGLFDRTLMQMILAGTLFAAVIVLALWGAIREYM